MMKSTSKRMVMVEMRSRQKKNEQKQAQVLMFIIISTMKSTKNRQFTMPIAKSCYLEQAIVLMSQRNRVTIVRRVMKIWKQMLCQDYAYFQTSLDIKLPLFLKCCDFYLYLLLPSSTEFSSSLPRLPARLSVPFISGESSSLRMPQAELYIIGVIDIFMYNDLNILSYLKSSFINLPFHSFLSLSQPWINMIMVLINDKVDNILLLMGGNAECKQCESDKQPLYIPPSSFINFKNLEESFEQYSNRNMLGFYSQRVQRNIAKLYFFQQQHVCDLILSLSESSTSYIRDKLLDDIESINLQQLDHLSIVKNLNMKSMQSLTNLAYEEEKQRAYYIQPAKSTSKLHTFDFKEKEGLRIVNKEMLVQKKPTDKISNIIKGNHFFIIATVGCFEKQSVLTPLALPTKKNLLRIFMQKVLAVNKRYDHPILVVFIVNPECQQHFDREIKDFELELSQDSNQILQELAPTFRWQKIMYRPCYPCMNYERKIQLNSEGIMFNNKSGDLIGFLSSNSRIRDLLKVYSFVQMANLTNIMQTVADKQMLIFLMENQCDVVAPIIASEKNGIICETLVVNRYFVEEGFSKRSEQSFKLAHTFYFRSNIFENRSMYYQNLLVKRIRWQVYSGQHKIIHFVRTFQDILYAPLTVFAIIPKDSCCVQKQEVYYSNYCKMLLGLEGTNQDEMVQICPTIVFGSKEMIIQVAESLRKNSQNIFPIIIKKAKKGSKQTL